MHFSTKPGNVLLVQVILSAIVTFSSIISDDTPSMGNSLAGYMSNNISLSSFDSDSAKSFAKSRVRV